MTSNYPLTYDNQSNLFLVRDALKMILTNDYWPGQSYVTVEGNSDVFARFPDNGIITLTDQVSDLSKRSLSFFYSKKDAMRFMGLELLPGQTDCFKPRIETVVTQNVMAIHRNVLKDAILAIQKFLGAKGTADAEPFGPTIVGRLNFLRRLVLAPRAWFAVSNNMGMVPFDVTFTADEAPKDGGQAFYEWDFGDGTSQRTYGPTVHKTYQKPGVYDAMLKVTNDFGMDLVSFPKMITAKTQSPAKATVELIPQEGQVLQGKVLRTPVNQFINVQVNEAGEHESDPVSKFTWNLADDLSHNNSRKTKALFTTGGLYDLALRVDTELGSYRITNLEKCIDVVEDTNLWLWTHDSPASVHASEFGLICETFKTRMTSKLDIQTNHSFLSDKTAAKEFKRNNGFVRRNVNSSKGGTCLLTWATGRALNDPPASEHIGLREYNAFLDTYTSHPAISHTWNWAMLAGEENCYFVFGDQESDRSLLHSPTKQLKTTLNLSNLATTQEPLVFGHYKAGAQELMKNPEFIDEDGNPHPSSFSVYRTAWKGHAGYILRNKPGMFTNLRGFYKTEGTIGDPFRLFRRLPDLDGAPKTEAQLVPLSRGIYCFNNSGSVSAFNDTAGVWEVSDANLTVTSFRDAYDRKVPGYDSENNTFLASSDNYNRAYLSFDYSPNAFVRFNEVDLSFHSLGHRPLGEQWLMGTY